MRVLMLGWEFPPFISGGLGTACYGLTRGLDRQGVQVLFVLPRPVSQAEASHVQILSPAPDMFTAPPELAPQEPGVEPARTPEQYTLEEFTHALFQTVHAGGGYRAYDRPWSIQDVRRELRQRRRIQRFERAARRLAAARIQKSQQQKPRQSAQGSGASANAAGPAVSRPAAIVAGPGAHYAGDLYTEVFRYADLVSEIAAAESFDVIHAHDWMTYPAGIAAARVSGRPLIAHVHSTEFDRAGEHVNQRVYDIERAGMHTARRIIAVSAFTRNIITKRYGVDGRRVDVVYNAVDEDDLDREGEDLPPIAKDDKLVLFLGRVTMQKGPEYFLHAAKRVLEVMQNVRFVMAGSGDMIKRMIELAAELGIGQKVVFTGFLRGEDVRRVYRMADLYVMPSVSEPFGIAPLEALANDVPVLISKQSGVAEVLTHALKVDFWDIDEMANKIVAVLRHPPLQATLRDHGSIEVRRFSWTDAAAECVKTYRKALK